MRGSGGAIDGGTTIDHNTFVHNYASEGAGAIYGIGPSGTVINNIFYDNEEDGVMFYRHPAGMGNIYNIYVVNNTCYNNRRFGILLNFETAESIVIRNNIC